jgi:hypothetical protein
MNAFVLLFLLTISLADCSPVADTSDKLRAMSCVSTVGSVCDITAFCCAFLTCARHTQCNGTIDYRCVDTSAVKRDYVTLQGKHANARFSIVDLSINKTDCLDVVVADSQGESS